jgi:hypothetical protein
MNPYFTNSSTEDLYFVKGSPGVNFPAVIKAGINSGFGAPDPEHAYTLTWTYSPDPGIFGTTSLSFECKFDDSGGLTITSSKTGQRANEWNLQTTQYQGGSVYYVTFLYQGTNREK